MAAPSVRMRAMKDKDQQQVWNSVRNAQASIARNMEAADAMQLESTTSYADVMGNRSVQRKLDDVAAPIERDYSKLIRELRERLLAADVEVQTSLAFPPVAVSSRRRQ